MRTETLVVEIFGSAGFYEHIVRDGEDTKNIQRYILENPLNWRIDRENPNVIE